MDEYTVHMRTHAERSNSLVHVPAGRGPHSALCEGTRHVCGVAKSRLKEYTFTRPSSSDS